VKKEFRERNSIKHHTIFETLELKLRGFLFRGKDTMTIDYSKLNDQIVRQAWNHTSAFLTEAQRQKLFQNKIDRAAAMIRAQEHFKRLANKG
jgi:CHASE3 domain sensor protein